MWHIGHAEIKSNYVVEVANYGFHAVPVWHFHIGPIDLSAWPQEQNSL